MSAEHILERLEGVRERNPGRWMALCPAHDDRSPSLSISDTDERVLLHCFAGCGASEVVAALDLSLDALFHDRAPTRSRGKRPAKSYRQVLKAISFEATVAAVAAEQLVRGEPLSVEDMQRLCVASQRIAKAREAAGG